MKSFKSKSRRGPDIQDEDSSQRSIHMNMETYLITRVGQGLLAVAATGVTALVLQLAMVAA